MDYSTIVTGDTLCKAITLFLAYLGLKKILGDQWQQSWAQWLSIFVLAILNGVLEYFWPHQKIDVGSEIKAAVDIISMLMVLTVWKLITDIYKKHFNYNQSNNL